MTRLRWFKFDIDAWIAGTKGMPARERGDYIALLVALYDAGGELALDPARLCLALDYRKAADALGAIQRLVDRGKVTIEDGKIRNGRVSAEVANRGRTEGEPALNRGRTEGEPAVNRRFRDKNLNDNYARLRGENQNQNLEDPSLRSGSVRASAPTPGFEEQPQALFRLEPDEAKPVAKPKPVRVACRLPDDFAPDLAEAARLGLLATDAEREAGAFVDHWRASNLPTAVKRDWAAAWRTWCRKTCERRQQQPAVAYRQPEKTRQQINREAMNITRENILARVYEMQGTDNGSYDLRPEDGGSTVYELLPPLRRSA